MPYDNSVLHRVWDVELEIMDVIHRICEENNLRYSLGFGSLIGAVRHAGFIPWDDDIDIVMPREDYEKFKHIWLNSAPSFLILQDKNIAPDFTQNFIKIRKDHTTFVQSLEETTTSYHKGIFVDIAPCDRVPTGKTMRKLHYFACAVNLLFSREHTSGNTGPIGIVEKMLLKIPKLYRPKLRLLAEQVMKHWNNCASLPYICPDTIQNCRRYYPPDLFENTKLTRFQDRNYYVISNPDCFLSVRYGAYMQLPPASERVWKHHPILIDFTHNYEELLDKGDLT